MTFYDVHIWLDEKFLQILENVFPGAVEHSRKFILCILEVSVQVLHVFRSSLNICTITYNG